ncbi:MAG: GNAT family N-acetyltransferase [Anaerolineales bacterium]|nr:GNAT family N-acetyltransferase [Anaerolineales bacterium]
MPTKKKSILRDLGDGLVLRRSTRADADALAEFNAKIHSDEGPEKPDERVHAWTYDLLTRPHPNFREDDFTIVQDSQTGKIVSSMNLISQTWSYAGIPFGVGRPELVGTDPEYRNRGLVRAQFEIIHQWSKERGEEVQAITGIPYYYRMFGYEMALNLGGGRVGFAVSLPKLKEGEEEPFQVRPAGPADLNFIADLYRQSCARSLVSCVWSADLWQYELTGKSEKNVNRMDLRIIQDKNGGYIGYLAHPHFTWGPALVASAYELIPGISWAAATPSVIRYLFAAGKALAEQEGKGADFGSFAFWLGEEHPVYAVLQNTLARKRKPYAWYVRLPEVADFIRHIAPVLNQRLAASSYSGHTGELKITFYQSGLLLGFEDGMLVKAEPWKPTPVGHSGDAGFPGLTFLQLLFGYRSYEELNYAFADCWWDHELALGLLSALFPKHSSDIWPVA